MSRLPNSSDQRLLELVAGKVLGDLSHDELLEFAELFSANDAKDLQELELAAAALQLTFADTRISEPVVETGGMRVDTDMPETLRARIAESSVNFVVPGSNSSIPFSPSNRGDSILLLNSSLEQAGAKPRPSSSIHWREVVSWLAAAASLIIAVQLWLSNDPRKPQIALAPTAAEARRALLNGSSSLVRADWAQGKTPFGSDVTGDVVWNNATQQGFMRFVGMPANDPTQEQYQLWIIDPERDTEPIDGGVFDVAAMGEVVVPIQAKLKVLKPTVFAITIEQPGGVVVSTQERLPLLAQVLN